MADTEPAIRYARSGDVHVAYQVVGDGPVDIVFVEGSITGVEMMPCCVNPVVLKPPVTVMGTGVAPDGL